MTDEIDNSGKDMPPPTETSRLFIITNVDDHNNHDERSRQGEELMTAISTMTDLPLSTTTTSTISSSGRRECMTIKIMLVVGWLFILLKSTAMMVPVSPLPASSLSAVMIEIMNP